MIDSTNTRPRSPSWDPSDPAFRANPYPYYDVLREDAPGFEVDGFVVLTRYDDVAATLRSPDVSRDILDQATFDPNDPIMQRRQQRSVAKTILTLDPPDHTRLRRLVSQAFTPRSIDRLTERIAAMTDAVLDTAEDRGEIELVEELAFPIPFNVISELLGVPTERADELRAWSHTITAALEPDASLDDLDAAEAAVWQLVPYLVTIINARRDHPQDDLLSALLAVEDDGDTLSAEELISFVLLLYVAGHETTVNLIGNGMWALLNNPGELQRWRADPTLDRNAIDELLRFDGPVQHTIRIPLVPMEFAGINGSTVVAQPHRAVLCVLGAANHDPAHFDHPDQLRLDRSNAASHLAFGSGIHHCLGAALARLEATTALTHVIRRFPTIEVVEAPEWQDRISIRGINRLKLNLRR